jgi:ABC-type dipeptide/oligopeptide/nickel transport system permease subunit
METTTIVALVALAYGAFLGYCLGRAQGYYKGADMAVEIYRSK